MKVEGRSRRETGCRRKRKGGNGENMTKLCYMHL